MSADISAHSSFSRVTNFSTPILNSHELSGDKHFFVHPAEFHLICEIILLSFIVYSALVTLRSSLKMLFLLALLS